MPFTQMRTIACQDLFYVIIVDFPVSILTVQLFKTVLQSNLCLIAKLANNLAIFRHIKPKAQILTAIAKRYNLGLIIIAQLKL